MKHAMLTKCIPLVLALPAAVVLGATGAAAQSPVTYVSGNGTDGGSCSRGTPCRTFSHAATQIVNEGTIICVDAGNYGGFVITKSLTIDCHAGGRSANSAQIIINAPSQFVKLLGVGLDALRQQTSLVINNAAAVHLDHVVVTGSNGAGILDQRPGGQLIITNSLVNLNFGVGVYAAGTLNVVLDNVTSAGNLYGVAAGAGARVNIKRSVMSGNTTAGIYAEAGAIIGVKDTLVSSNGTGIVANSGSGLRISNSDINSNSTAISGTVRSTGDNNIFNNVSTGTAPLPVANPMQ